MGFRTKTLPFKPPPPPPKDGSPPYYLFISGYEPTPYRDFIKALRDLRSCPALGSARIIRKVDGVLLAFRVREGQSVKNAVNAATDAHVHRKPKKKLKKKIKVH